MEYQLKLELYYLAAPYSHPNPAIRQHRFDSINRVAAKIMESGLMAVFSPISHSHPIALAGNLPTSFNFWEQFDRKMLSACDKMIVLKLPGWQQSVGVQAEIAIAREMGMPIYYIDEEGEWNVAEFQAAIDNLGTSGIDQD